MENLIRVIATDKAPYHETGKEYDLPPHHAKRMLENGRAVLPGEVKADEVKADEVKADEVKADEVKATVKNSNKRK